MVMSMMNFMTFGPLAAADIWLNSHFWMQRHFWLLSASAPADEDDHCQHDDDHYKKADRHQNNDNHLKNFHNYVA